MDKNTFTSHAKGLFAKGQSMTKEKMDALVDDVAEYGDVPASPAGSPVISSNSGLEIVRKDLIGNSYFDPSVIITDTYQKQPQIFR